MRRFRIDSNDKSFSQGFSKKAWTSHRRFRSRGCRSRGHHWLPCLYFSSSSTAANQWANALEFQPQVATRWIYIGLARRSSPAYNPDWRTQETECSLGVEAAFFRRYGCYRWYITISWSLLTVTCSYIPRHWFHRKWFGWSGREPFWWPLCHSQNYYRFGSDQRTTDVLP